MKRKVQLTSALCFLFFLHAKAQDAPYSGKVKNDSAEALSGVTVKDKSTGLSATTDKAGSFKLDLSPGQHIVSFKLKGYVDLADTVTVVAGVPVVKNITLLPALVRMGEVVVIGYGTTTRRDLTGSVSTIKGSDVQDMPAPSFEAAIQGKAAGVQITTGSGVAGSGSLVRIRGVASISASGDPLYIVDGIPISQNYFVNGNNGGFNNNPLATLNPEDIESIEILKDAAATSIYGSRGSNGVMLITTKRANKTGLKFEFTSRVGTSQPTYKPQMLNSSQFLQMYQEAWENDGGTGLAPLPNNISWEDALKTNTNWVDQTMGAGVKQMYSLNTSYRKKNFGAYLGLTMDNNGSFVIGSKYKRSSARLNLDYNPIKNLTLSLSSSFSQGLNSRVDGAWSGGFGAAMSTALPIYPIYDTSGAFWRPGAGNLNPVAVRKLKDWRTTENRTINNFKATYKISDKWFVTAFGALDNMEFYEDIYEPKALINTDHAGIAKRSPRNTFNYNYNVVTNYTVLDNEKHYLDAMLGTEFQRSTIRSSYREKTDMSHAYFEGTQGGEKATELRRTNATEAFAFVSYFMRMNYKLNNKYIFQFTMRTDGSSRFGPNNAYGFFPAVSGAWIVSDEKFMTRFRRKNFLKVKTGFGRTGNTPNENYAWRGTFTPPQNSYGYNGQPSIFPTRLENPDLKWETSDVFDFTIEGGFMKNRFTWEISYYNKKTSGVILDLAVPKSLGFSSYYDNVGAVRNTGLEFSIVSRNIVKKFFTWTTNFNIARNYNKILNIGVYTQDAVSGGTNDTRVVVGQPIGTNYLVRFSHVEKSTGRPVYLDKDGNETYTWTNNDRVAVGSVLPKAVGGLTNSFTYKGWNLSFLMVYKIGGNIYNSSAKRQNGVVTDWNMTTDYFDHWRQNGDDPRYPKLSMQTSAYGLPPDPYQYNTTLFLEDGSYLRLRNLTLGYRLPSKWFGKRIQSCRLIFTGVNLLTFTKYTGGDPEIARDFENPADRNMSSNITYLTAPQEKSYNLTLNLTF
ncbi:MAG: SusC/RagA family TonB-linked outer membrane protein [Bacteroidia bacterium]|jgi:TonB-linked SusC/RagA family outer membrane protein